MTARIDTPAVPDGPVLLTGATGFLGTELLARLLEETDRPVLALIRAPTAAEADSRLRTTMAGLFEDPERHAGRVRALCGDLTADGLGLDDEAHTLALGAREIIHGAASVSFDLSLAESRAINVEGTRRMLTLADACARHGSLRRFTYVSTAYVAGERRGRVAEGPSSGGARFRNAYERSKCEAERLVQAAAERLPVTVVRPSIVVGDQVTGWTSSFNVIYAPLRAFGAGAFGIVPGRRSSPVDVVPVDYVARATLALAADPAAAGRTFHLVAADEARSAGELADLAAARMGRRAPAFVPPLAYHAVLRPLALRRTPEPGRRLLRRNEAYFPYFRMRQRFDDRAARALLEPLGIRPAPLPDYFDRLIEFAEAARWGRRPIGRAEAAVLAGAPPAQTARPTLSGGTAAHAPGVARR